MSLLQGCTLTDSMLKQLYSLGSQTPYPLLAAARPTTVNLESFQASMKRLLNTLRILCPDYQHADAHWI